MFTFLSPLSSSMIAPASGQIATKFGITNEVIIAMLTSIFVLAFAVSLLVGRQPSPRPRIPPLTCPPGARVV